MTRETLLNRVRRNYDEEAWKEFVFYYRGYVYNIASRMGLGHHDVEEVVQNVMLKLWKKLPEFQYDSSKGRFRGWLCTVTANKVKQLRQHKSRDLERLTPGEREELTQYLHEIHTTPDPELAEQEWVTYIITMAWERVGKEFGTNEKAAFEMLSKGAGVDEVSNKLGIATSSVYVYKKRVTDRLKEGGRTAEPGIGLSGTRDLFVLQQKYIHSPMIWGGAGVPSRAFCAMLTSEESTITRLSLDKFRNRE